MRSVHFISLHVIFLISRMRIIIFNLTELLSELNVVGACAGSSQKPEAQLQPHGKWLVY